MLINEAREYLGRAEKSLLGENAMVNVANSEVLRLWRQMPDDIVILLADRVRKFLRKQYPLVDDPLLIEVNRCNFMRSIDPAK